VGCADDRSDTEIPSFLWMAFLQHIVRDEIVHALQAEGN